ncbi:MAG: RNA polymerase sigma factor [Burkholderiales bacterium]
MTSSREERSATWDSVRRELINYATRMVLRKDVAEELVQQAGLRLIEAESPPQAGEGTRAWLFRVVTNLAIDHLRRYSTKNERIMAETKDAATANEAFMAEMGQMRGTEEHRAMARDHLSVCFSCTMRVFPANQAAALLLVEVFGFSVAEAADILGARAAQAKNWIQSARAGMQQRYAQTCALVSKNGVCHECVELSGYFTGVAENPLANTAGDIDSRLAILHKRRESALNPWHTKLMLIVDGLLSK